MTRLSKYRESRGAFMPDPKSRLRPDPLFHLLFPRAARAKVLSGSTWVPKRKVFQFQWYVSRTSHPSPEDALFFLISQRSPWGLRLAGRSNTANVLPYRPAVLDPDPRRYSTHGLRNNECLLYLFSFISGAPSIARVTRLSSRRADDGSPTRVLLVKDVALSRSPVDEATRVERAHAHKSNLSPVSNPVLLFFGQSGRESE